MAVDLPGSWVTHRSIVLRGDWLCTVWYSWRLTQFSIILQEEWLTAVSYCRETDSAQYDTVLQGDFFEKFDWLSLVYTGYIHYTVKEKQLTCWANRFLYEWIWWAYESHTRTSLHCSITCSSWSCWVGPLHIKNSCWQDKRLFFLPSQ